ncbi:hypothetical protein OIE75_21860 [Streptomyces sp. NBC_01723]|uniref:hypothetical protein n=1 Tax=unclassified Streptomyces TaxID=2593676 RepID=UPI0027897CFF|nr:MULTISPECIES: hypothetical protein [unclassified Streptomyces]MDQ0405596.1 hypothetical protein [Streptomyces sp. DSM 40167]
MDLLPVNGAALAADPRAAEAIGAVSARHGVDYMDDGAVSALLAERRRAMEGERRHPSAWLGILALTVGLLLPFVASTIRTLSEHRLIAVLAASGCLVVVGTALVVYAYTRWRRALNHPTLAGYRETLGIARAHGIPLTHIPPWLVGKSSPEGGKGVAPIPSYPPVEPSGEADQLRQADGLVLATPAPVAVPPKPAAVSEYEWRVNEGGWHTEAGCLLLLLGGGGAAYAATSSEPGGYAALILVPVALYAWLAGSRQGNEKERLRQEALTYVRAIADAQAAGARVPELSFELRKLVDEA